jgi:hypothetical protein
VVVEKQTQQQTISHRKWAVVLLKIVAIVGIWAHPDIVHKSD